MGKLSLDNIIKTVGTAKAATGALKFKPYQDNLPLSAILLHPDNEFAENDTPSDIQEMADDIKLNGLINPLTVNKAGGKYRLLSGECRFRALQKLGYTHVRCTIYENLSSAEELRILYAANLKVRNYTIAQRLSYYEKLKGLLTEQKANGQYDGPVQAGIADIMGVSDRQIRKYDRISQNLNSEAKKELTEGKISVEQAYKIAQGKSKTHNYKQSITAHETGSTSGKSVKRSIYQPTDKEKATEFTQINKSEISATCINVRKQLLILSKLIASENNQDMTNRVHRIVTELNDIMEDAGYITP